MHVGYNAAFQNPHDALGDDAVYENELRLCDLAVELGFESLWTVEHHFDDYTMCPDPVQWLSYMAGKHPDVLLGSGVIVLPWHDPLRVAEQVALLDHVSRGRMILGIGRGLARIEYDGFRVDMNTSRERFVEYARLISEALETGYMEYDNEFGTQPRRQIRPRPVRSFRGRTYAAAVSPESMPLMAGLGIGVLVIPQKPWPTVQQDVAEYERVYREVNGGDPPRPISGGFVFCDESADRAEEMARTWIGENYASVMRHYEFAAAPHEGVKGYEFYTGITRYVERHGVQGAIDDFVNLMPWGTPDQILAKFEHMRTMIDMSGLLPGFSYGGMPYDLAEAQHAAVRRAGAARAQELGRPAAAGARHPGRPALTRRSPAACGSARSLRRRYCRGVPTSHRGFAVATFDVHIKGGTIVDGTRVPRFRADVWIKDGRIAQIGGRAPGSRRAGHRRRRVDRRARASSICTPTTTPRSAGIRTARSPDGTA